MSKSVGVKKKSIWRDKASMELLMLCVPTLLAFTLFHYVPMIGIIAHHIAPAGYLQTAVPQGKLTFCV